MRKLILLILAVSMLIQSAMALTYGYDTPRFEMHDPYEEGRNMMICGHVPSFVIEDNLTVFTSLDIKELEVSPVNINTWALVNYTAPNGSIEQYNLSKSGWYWSVGRYPIHLVSNKKYQVGKYEIISGLEKCTLVVDKPINKTVGHYKGQTSQGHEIEFDVFDEEVDNVYFSVNPTCQGKGHGFGLYTTWYGNSFIFSYNYILNWTMKPIRIKPKENFAVYGRGWFVNSTYVKGNIRYASPYFTGDKEEDILKTAGCQKSYSFYAEWVGDILESPGINKLANDMITIDKEMIK